MSAIVKHTRVELTITKIRPVCPYCKERPIRKPYHKTCGHFACQYKHHILEMRKDRKTERRAPSRRVEF